MIRVKHACLGALIVAAAIACADKGTTSIDGNDPLAGLKQSSATDSSGNSLPPTSGHDTATATPGGGGTGGIDTLHSEPGYFRGYVRSSEVIQGVDTLAGSVRIPDVKVDAYARLANGDAGALTASVVTNAQGEWQLPVLPAGHYLVTFTPPANSQYQGVWVTATPNSHSHEWPWWVTLPKK
jgi:hypothetical protein